MDSNNIYSVGPYLITFLFELLFTQFTIGHFRPVLVLDTQGRPINQHVSVTTHQAVQNGGQRTHYTTVQNNAQHIQTNVHTGGGGNTDGSGKISQVVYTSGPSFGAHQPQYAYAHNGFINTVQGQMTQILPANLSQGEEPYYFRTFNVQY